ncbi:MAG: proton-conducting transporter membrane subunit [Campylobacterota bacterium]|nr:proton-conducting transporter membrane subunit [Campylobacterota bacterium]
MSISSLLIISPIFFALVMMNTDLRARNILAILFVIILSALSLMNIAMYVTPFEGKISHSFHNVFIVIDTLLLLYFLVQGLLSKNYLVGGLAIVQMILYSIVLYMPSALTSSDIVIDNISSTMFLVINIVGGIIIIYALKYIESEDFTRFKKNGFIAILFFFLAVMNFIVSTNNIEVFFMLFELTTLSSYVLIGYRRDKLSTKNALQALWMNQIGGVVILLALILSISQYDTIYFDILIANIDELYLLPIVLLAIAGFVKGATIPFEKWLLGAMIAPTPVSAILHSATMVKIAPYLMLKLAPAMSGFVSVTITLIGTFVFLAASLLALSKDYFKEILGLSTIALLALMMALAAVGTLEATTACLIFILFHAISKALLFLQAGILEKNFHLKYVDDIDGLINHSPLVVFFIIVGFASLTLPPFGAFIAKFMAIESISDMINTNPLYVIAIIFIALGSVFLTLLYFKVVSKLFAKDMDKKYSHVEISKYYTVPSFVLLTLLIIGIYISFDMGYLSALEILTPTVLIAIVPFLFRSVLFKNTYRVKEYHCGEKEELKVSMFYFEITQKYVKMIMIISIALMIVLVLGVLV